MGNGRILSGNLLGTLTSADHHVRSLQHDPDESRPPSEFNRYCILMTAACYAGCYLLALFRCRRRFKKMNIHHLMNANKQNEEIKESNEKLKRWLLPVSILFMLAFGVFLFCG